MTEVPIDPVEVYRARGLPDAHALRLLLDAEGIAAWIDNELLQGAAGELPLGWNTAPRVMVGRPDESAARSIVGRFARDRPPPDPPGDLACLACRALMGAANTCPACGWSYYSEGSEIDSGPADAALDLDDAPSAPDPACPTTGDRSRREGWAELAAVLAVGVVPFQLSAVTAYFGSLSPVPYWLDALHLIILSGCTIFVTLYLIHRSGDEWAAFGIVRPGVVDVVTGLVFLFMAHALWTMISGLPDFGRPPASPIPRPGIPLDFVLLAVKYAVSAFSEELVCRAYLVTRLTGLLRSPTAAVVYGATAFATYHLYQGLQGVGFAFAFGVGYGAAFLVFRRVWPLAIGHALYDIMVDLSAG